MAGDEEKVDLTSWKKILLQYGFQYGFPGVIALILLGALLGVFENPLTKTVSLLEAEQQALQRHDASSIETRQTIARALELQNSLLRQICVQQAPTNNDRLRCVGITVQ